MVLEEAEAVEGLRADLTCFLLLAQRELRYGWLDVDCLKLVSASKNLRAGSAEGIALPELEIRNPGEVEE